MRRVEGRGFFMRQQEDRNTESLSNHPSHIPYRITASSLAIPDCLILLPENDYLENETRTSPFFFSK
jgi:hypothetical protein